MGCFKSSTTSTCGFLCILTLSLVACGQKKSVDVSAEPVVHEAPVIGTRSDSSVSGHGSDTSSLKEENWREYYAEEQSSITGAASLDEAKWLSRNGFLTRQERTKFARLARQDIERLARTGDANAVLYLAEQDIDAGRGGAATYGLNRLVQTKASIPALHLLAKQAHEAEAAGGGIGTGPSAAATRLMQAFVRGDYKAGQMLSRIHPGGVPPVVFSDAMQNLTLEQESYKESNGGKSPPFDPRPIQPNVKGLVSDAESFWKKDGDMPELR